MQAKCTFNIALFLFFTCLFVSAQSPEDKAKETILSFWDLYQKDIQDQIVSKQRKLIRRKIGPQAAEDYEKSDDKTAFLSNMILSTFNNQSPDMGAFQTKFDELERKYGYQNRKMIDRFKANEISSFFGGVSSLGIQEFNASYNTANQQISVGKNWNLQGEEGLSRLHWILNTGFTIATKNEFANVVENGVVQRENIILNLTLSKLAKGHVNFDNAVSEPIYSAILVDHRDNLLEGKMTERAEDFIKKHFDTALDSLQRLNNKAHNPRANYQKALNNYAVGKRNKYYNETVSEEIRFLKGNRLYKSFETHWFSLNVNLPFGSQNFTSGSSIQNAELQENNFNAWNANFSFNYLFKNTKGASFIFNPTIALKNNNNFLAGLADESTFQSILDQGNNQQALVSSETVFIGNYNEFLTFSGKIDVASLFIKQKAGLRVAYEKNFGDFDDSIFLIGFPAIVKDKKNKPIINLEFQYRRINGDNQWGIATSLLFASLIK